MHASFCMLATLALGLVSDGKPVDSEKKGFSGQAEPGRICATVNGTPIYDSEVREAAYARLVETVGLPDPERTNRQRQIIGEELERLIDREVILSEAFARLKGAPQFVEKLQEAAGEEFDKAVRSYKDRAKKSGLNIKNDEELKAILRAQGQSLEGIRRQVERSFISMEYMRSQIYPIVQRECSPERIKDYYDRYANKFPADDGVGVRPLDETLREEIRTKLKRLIADREYKRILAELKAKAKIERHLDP